MPSFESPLTNKKFAAQPMRDIEVPDESGYNQPPPNMGPKFNPSVSHRMDPNFSEQDIQDFQNRMNANMNPDSNLSDIEREIKHQREEKIRGQTHLNDGARRRIEMLIGMTRLYKTVIIDENNTFALQTLKGKEKREAIVAASQFDRTVESPFEIRLQFLARALTHVANVPIEQFIGSNSLGAKLEFIEELDDILLNRLMDEYTALDKEAQNKYSMQTVEQAKEIAEDLKK